MITGIVITLNEAQNITSVITSLKTVCDEILIVDSQSDDGTPDLAKALGAKVISQSYLGDGYQKNVGLPHASNDWILSLDADETLDKEAIQSIQNLKFESIDAHTFYEIKRKTFIGNRWIRHCGWYPDKCIRLFNKKTAKWKETIAHSQVMGGRASLLEGNIIHHSFVDYSDMFRKANRFSNRGAKQIIESGKSIGPMAPFLHGLNSLIKTYIFKRGYLDGIDGLTVSIYNSLCSYLKYAKAIEIVREDKDIKNIWGD